MNQFSPQQPTNPAQSMEGTLDVTASLVQTSLDQFPTNPTEQIPGTGAPQQQQQAQFQQPVAQQTQQQPVTQTQRVQAGQFQEGQQRQQQPGAQKQTHQDTFLPLRPKTLKETKLTKNDMGPLLLKFLFLHGVQSGHRIADQVKLPFDVVEPILQALKADMLVGLKAAAVANDYMFELSPKGIEQAKMHLERSTYCGSAPVSLQEYRNAVLRQSLKNSKPTFEKVADALSDLVISKMMINQLGQAISSGKSMFLYGEPGNGKSSIARRAIHAIGEHIWIPRAITIGGEIVRLYDPSLHVARPLPNTVGIMKDTQFDDRWVRIERPCISVGGELTLSHLEASANPVTGIIEAPVHVKSNGGCLIVDDFGRQQISSTELLNRWIVPMETGNDFLTLPSGRQVSLPFEQLLIFSTNLEPRDLCDEAFLRRIPYKVEVFDPTESQYRRLFANLCQKYGVQTRAEVIDYLIEYHYKRVDRPFRFCHVDDLLQQARDFCEFHNKEWTFTKEIAELACLNYFSGMKYDKASPPTTNVSPKSHPQTRQS